MDQNNLLSQQISITNQQVFANKREINNLMILWTRIRDQVNKISTIKTPITTTNAPNTDILQQVVITGNKITCGIIESNDITIKPDLAVGATTADLTIQEGDLTIQKGDLTIQEGDLTIQKGDLTIQDGNISSHTITHFDNHANGLLRYSEGRVSSFNQSSRTLNTSATASGIYYDTQGDYFQLKLNPTEAASTSPHPEVYKEFKKIANETDHLDAVYMAVDISDYNIDTSDTCEIFFRSVTGHVNSAAPNTSNPSSNHFIVTKKITGDGRYTFHSNFPNNMVNIGVDQWTSCVFHLGIRITSATSNTNFVRITGAYIETELKFGEGIRGVSFSPEGGAAQPDRKNPVTDGHQYPYHDFPVRTTDAIKKAYESGFNLLKTYNMPSNPLGSSVEPIGTSILSQNPAKPGLLLQIKNFNDSLPLNQQHRRIRLSLGMEHNVYTDAVPTSQDTPVDGTLAQNTAYPNRNKMHEVAYQAVRDYDFIHSIYLGNERVTPFSFFSFYDQEFKDSWPPALGGPNGWRPADAISTAIEIYLRPAIEHFRNTYCTIFPYDDSAIGTESPTPGITFGHHGKRCVLTYAFAQTAAALSSNINSLRSASSSHTGDFNSNKEIGLDFISANVYGDYNGRAVEDNSNPGSFITVESNDDLNNPPEFFMNSFLNVVNGLQSGLTSFQGTQRTGFQNRIVISETGWQNQNKHGAVHYWGDPRRSGNQEWQQRFFDILNRYMYKKTFNGFTYNHNFLYSIWFVFTNEDWKGDDNYWGVFSEGDSVSIGKRRITTDNWIINTNDNLVKIPVTDSIGNALTTDTEYIISTGNKLSDDISFVRNNMKIPELDTNTVAVTTAAEYMIRPGNPLSNDISFVRNNIKIPLTDSGGAAVTTDTEYIIRTGNQLTDDIIFVKKQHVFISFGCTGFDRGTQTGFYIGRGERPNYNGSGNGNIITTKTITRGSVVTTQANNITYNANGTNPGIFRIDVPGLYQISIIWRFNINSGGERSVAARLVLNRTNPDGTRTPRTQNTTDPATPAVECNLLQSLNTFIARQDDHDTTVTMPMHYIGLLEANDEIEFYMQGSAANNNAGFSGADGSIAKID